MKRSLDEQIGCSRKKGGSQRDCHFKSEWKTKYPINSCSVCTAFYCIPCEEQVSCSHQGEKDVTRYCSSQGHQDSAKVLLNQPKFKPLYPEQFETAVIRTECMMTNFIVQHNLPFTVSDHLTKMFPKMFNDSKIAKQYACERTKRRVY